MSRPAGTRLPTLTPPFPIVVPHAVRPNLRPLGGAPALDLADDHPELLTRALDRLWHDEDGVVVRDPDARDEHGLLAALEELWGLAAGELPHAVRVEPAGPGRATAVRLAHLGVVLTDGRARRTGRPWPELGDAGRAAQAHLCGLRGLRLAAHAVVLGLAEDVVVLRRDGPGPGRASVELACVTFPTGWSPRERAGADHLSLHAPVADNERLLAAGPALTEALLTKGPFVQHAWGIASDARLDFDPLAPDAAIGGWPRPSDAVLRVERQTSRGLPDLGRALFTIRLYRTRLRDLDRVTGQAATLAAALASMSDASADYKGLADVRDELVRYLRSGSAPGAPGT